MNEKQYSNREIDRYFLEIKGSLDRIETQTTRTNGRVTCLETGIVKVEDKVKADRRVATIIWIILVVIIFPLLVYINQLQIEHSALFLTE